MVSAVEEQIKRLVDAREPECELLRRGQIEEGRGFGKDAGNR